MPSVKSRLSFDPLYEPYDLNAAHKNRLQQDQPNEQIIREYDYNNLPEWFTNLWKINFFPLTKEQLKERELWYSLQNKKIVANQYALYEYPERMIQGISEPVFWLSLYKYWLIKYNEYNELVIRTHFNHPDSRLGIGIFTKR
jgi:hypothetical protein